MDTNFTISVEHDGQQREYQAKFIRIGYIHQFHVDVEGNSLIIEFDEERDYRVINSNPAKTDLSLPQELLLAIVRKISALHD